MVVLVAAKSMTVAATHRQETRLAAADIIMKAKKDTRKSIETMNVDQTATVMIKTTTMSGLLEGNTRATDLQDIVNPHGTSPQDTDPQDTSPPDMNLQDMMNDDTVETLEIEIMIMTLVIQEAVVPEEAVPSMHHKAIEARITIALIDLAIHTYSSKLFLFCIWVSTT